VSAPEPVHPLASVLRPGRHGAEADDPLRLDIPARDIVQVLARRGRAGRVAAAMGLPGPGASSTTPLGTALWLQPGVWAITAPRGPEAALARNLFSALGESAAIIDQSHGRVTIGIEGGHARRMLAKGIRLDLHPAAFPVGAAAVTECAHLGVLLHRPAETRLELIVVSTFARELMHWITEAAAEFGYTIR
jgi:heterotetrameric sarcosine oxidase gamma subunit